MLGQGQTRIQTSHALGKEGSHGSEKMLSGSVIYSGHFRTNCGRTGLERWVMLG